VLDDRTRFQLAQVDHWDHEAFDGGADGAVAGISRYMRLPEPRTAVVAVAVTDRWRGAGHRELAAAADRSASPGGRHLLPDGAMPWLKRRHLAPA
jgi:hypothetical protein